MNSGEFNVKILSRKERMYRLAKSILCDTVEAEDVVQDIFERLWLRREVLGSYENLDSFILTSVRNACLDRLRSRKTRLEKSVDIKASSETMSDGVRSVEMRDMKAMIELVISQLPDRQRTVIHLKDIEGCETEEIARLIDIDEAAVRMNLSRARKTVREKLINIMNHGLGRSVSLTE